MPISSATSAAGQATGERPRQPPGDVDLLRRFLDQRDEVAFAELVTRYGEMVFATALRTLRDRHASEDVLQATFLVLARDGNKLRQQASLGAWLHGIALRLAKKGLLRRRRTSPLENPMDVQIEQPLLEEMSRILDQQLLDEELANLPAAYREPLVLHFLQGKTYEQTAQALGTTVGAIEGRLKRGKRELHLRLMRRGIEVTAVLTAIAWSQSAAQAAIQPQLISAAVQAGLAMAQGAAFAPACSPEAVQLAAQETAMFTAGKVATATVGLLTATTMGWLGGSGIGGTGAGLPGASPGGIETVAVSELVLAQNQEGDSIPVSGAVGQSGSVGQSGAAGTAAPAAGGAAGGFGGGSASGTTGFGAAGSASSAGAIREADPNVNPYGAKSQYLDPPPFGMRGSYGNPNSRVPLGAYGGGYEGQPGMPGGGMMIGYGSPGPRVDKIAVSWNRGPAAERIETAMSQQTNFMFPGNSLSEVIEYIQELQSIPIRLDTQTLEDAGVAIDTEVKLTMSDVSLESFLNLLLENVGGVELTYVIRNEVLLITTAEAADEFLETRIYDVRPLMIKDPGALTDVIMTATEGPWMDTDGVGGSLSSISGQFVIRQTQQQHREIEALLDNLLKNLNDTTYPVPDWPVQRGGFGSGQGGGFGGGGAAGGGMGGGGAGGGQSEGTTEGAAGGAAPPATDGQNGSAASKGPHGRAGAVGAGAGWF